jgi:hypothetical protein
MGKVLFKMKCKWVNKIEELVQIGEEAEAGKKK